MKNGFMIVVSLGGFWEGSEGEERVLRTVCFVNLDHCIHFREVFSLSCEGLVFRESD